ncbi:helix-turn-helix transcriptional regulator [Spirosoma koreense]
MDLLNRLANLLGGQIDQGVLTLPPTAGQGSIRTYDLGPNLTMLIVQCALTNDLAFRRKASDQDSDRVIFSFRQVFSPLHEPVGRAPIGGQRANQLPSVQVTSGTLEVDLYFPARIPINTILLITPVEVLRSLLHQPSAHPLLQGILAQDHPYVYEELISPGIQQVAAQLVGALVPQPLHDFYLKIKAQELICLFFVELLKRQGTVSYSLNGADIRRMYLLRDRLLSDLSQPPELPALATLVGMSESKMKRLFRQIFGSSIYQYYQTFRMREAAYLIREQKLSISETGLQLGFTNLSHFTRIFEKHMGQKPKKYSVH